MILTYRYRVKDGTASRKRALRRQASAVNFVWNYCCEIDRQAQDRWRAGRAVRRPSAFDLATLCRGITKELGIHSDTVDAICNKFAAARDAIFPKTPRFRTAKRNLDWIPFTNFARPAKIVDGGLILMRRRYPLWVSRPMPKGSRPKSWNMGCDSRGRWYANIQVEVAEGERKTGPAVGVDLGLKTLAALSNGRKIEMPGFYRKAEAALAKWHRYGKRKRATALAAKIANQRRHYLHVVSAELVRDYATIIVGDVRPSQIGKTKMAKSVYDAGWTTLRQMLRYKAIAHGAAVEIVSEKFTTQVCSSCGALPPERPRGIADLGMRRWDCSDCGASHDRDVNAALNILRVGLECQPPAGEIPAS